MMPSEVINEFRDTLEKWEYRYNEYLRDLAKNKSIILSDEAFRIASRVSMTLAEIEHTKMAAESLKLRMADDFNKGVPEIKP